jgi:hypothetical protein
MFSNILLEESCDISLDVNLLYIDIIRFGRSKDAVMIRYRWRLAIQSASIERSVAVVQHVTEGVWLFYGILYHNFE